MPRDDTTDRTPVRVPEVRPLLIGSRNAETMLGVSWRWVRDHAESLGLTILKVDGKSFIEAAAVVEAIKRHATFERVEPVEPVDELAELRRSMGKRRRAG